MKKTVIGILTWHYYPNFGSALQAFALQQSISKLGYKAEVINYRNKKFGRYDPMKQRLKAFVHRMTGGRVKRLAYPFPWFQRYCLNETKCVMEADDLKALCDGYRSVVCGSDQIWAPNALNPVYLLGFLPDETERISYAASIGLNVIPEAMRAVYAGALTKFKAVSVREAQGAELLKSLCGIRANVVLDPTFLLTRAEWEHMERPVAEKNGYIFCYFLKKDHHYRERVTEYANENGLRVIGVSANGADSAWMALCDRIGPGEFLWLIHHADTVITDSYHGTIFSMIYHKRFFTIERFSKDEDICQNSRIDQLKLNFGLSDEIVPQSLPDKFTAAETNYADFDRRLARLREDSIAFLRTALR